jgi:hypothetical protein
VLQTGFHMGQSCIVKLAFTVCVCVFGGGGGMLISLLQKLTEVSLIPELPMAAQSFAAA